MSQSIHSVKREQAHLAWDNSIPPVLRIESGETVSFDCLDASNGQITRTSIAAHLAPPHLDFTRLDQVNGPVYIEGARPGDVLEVRVLTLEPADWGWTGVIPGFGLLSDDPDFAVPHLRVWELGKDGYAEFPGRADIKVPLRPFAGEMGIARAAPGKHSTIPPYRTGGNLDCKHLCAGARLWLPVEVEGALFSIGDGHAAQGDGEVCGTAIETPMRISVQFILHSAPSLAHLDAPHFLTTLPHSHGGAEYYGTTGVADDVREATRAAVRAMIAHLGAEHGLSRADAYMLCSVAGDLRMCEVVDMPNYVIAMMIPKSIFGPHAHGEGAAE